jgi:hypothetical protein
MNTYIQVCGVLSQIAKHTVDLAEVILIDRCLSNSSHFGKSIKKKCVCHQK